MTLQEAAANFVVSYLADNIPVLKDFVKPDLERRIKKCYNSALKEWKCKAVRERYEGKDLTLLEDLKQYVLGNNGEVDAELLFRWAYNMQSDDVCADYLNSLKEDELLSRTSQFSVLFSDLVQDLRSVSNQLQNVEGKVDRQGEVLEDIKESGRDIKKTVESMSAKVDVLYNAVDCPQDYEKLSSELENYLSEQLDKKQKCHPSFRLMDIDDELFPGGIPKLNTIEAINDSDEIKTVQKIVEDSWNRKEKNHLMIEGEGGIGKTVTLLSLPDKFIPHKIPAVYVQLHELKSVNDSETIESYLKVNYFNNNETLFNHFINLTNKPWQDGPQVLLLFDGFNEITPERKFTIGEDIKQWASRPGVQIVTSSRYDIHSYVPIGEGYSRVLLQPLKRETIEEYLKRLQISCPKDDTQWNIINYPLMLTLYAQTTKAIKELAPIEQQAFKENNSAGAIIWNYLQREIWRFRQKPEDLVKCVLSAEVIAPSIAWRMQKNNSFSLPEETFWKYIDDAYESVSRYGKKQFPIHYQQVLRKIHNSFPSVEEVQSFIEDDLHLFFKRSDGSYALMHQQFRDALAAIHLINVSYSSDILVNEWKTPVDYYVMSFVTDLISPDEAGRLWEHNRKARKEDIATINMLELQKQIRCYNFSELNFCGLDLSRVSLYPYRVPGTSTLKMPQKPEQNKNLSVTSRTFLPEGHSNAITDIKITPDGKRCISASEDSTLRIWDIETGMCLRVLEGHQGAVNTFAITPDGRKCVSGANDRILRVWDIETGASLRILKKHRGRILTCAITPDGTRCISGASDRVLHIWDIETGQLITSLKGQEKKTRALSITPDGKYCISVSNYRTLRVWDILNGKCIKDMNGHTAWIGALVISFDGKRCISGANDCTVRVWDIESGKCAILPGHCGAITDLAISSNGTRCVSASEDKTLRVWDIETGICLKVLEGHKDIVSAITITPDGKRCISGSNDKTLRVWDIETGICLKVLEGHDNRIKTLAVSPGGRVCLSGSEDKTLRVWDLETSECLRTMDGHNNWIRTLAVSPDCKRIVCGLEDITIRVWDSETVKCQRVMMGHAKSIRALVISPDGEKCISGSNDMTIRIWNIETGSCLRVLEGHKNRIRTLAITPDGTRCISGSDDYSLRIWDIKTGECLKVLEGHADIIFSVSITSNGKRCISGSNDSTLRVWDIETGKCLWTLVGHTNRIKTLAISPDGRWCASGSDDNTIRVWSIETGECIRILEGHTNRIRSLDFTPNGEFCVSGSEDHTLRVWDIKSAACLKVLKGHKHWVNALAVFSDGQTCISGSNDSLRIWDLKAGKCRKVFNVQKESMRELVVTQDEKKCIYGSENVLGIIDLDSYIETKIVILPLSLIGVDFSQASVSLDLRETLRKNGVTI